MESAITISLLDKLKKRIDSETDPQRRAEMMEHYGTRKYWVDSGAIPIHQDNFGTLFRYVLNGNYSCLRADCCYSYYVCVVNSTPEPDGSSKDYFIPVPPDMVSARHAVAWTFGMEAQEYGPFSES